MSLSISFEFEQLLYNLLAEDADLKGLVQSINLSVKADNKYPFLLIQFKKSSNLSKHLPTYQIEAEIIIFSREKSKSVLSAIFSRIEYLINNWEYGLDCYKSYYLQSCRVISSAYFRSEDLMTDKNTLTLLALLQQRTV